MRAVAGTGQLYGRAPRRVPPGRTRYPGGGIGPGSAVSLAGTAGTPGGVGRPSSSGQVNARRREAQIRVNTPKAAKDTGIKAPSRGPGSRLLAKLAPLARRTPDTRSPLARQARPG